MKKIIIIASILIISLLIIIGAFLIFKKINIQGQSLVEKGSVLQKDFKEEISFTIENGWTIIPVEIDGKKYKFILDTGALNIVSLELAKELNLNIIGNHNGISSTGNSQTIDLAEVPNVNIGGVEFVNTTTAILDIKNQFKCSNIDGLIGSNLMKNAIWKVDNKNKKIILTNSVDKLNLKNFNDKVSFSTNKQANPYFNLEFGNVNIKTLFDTGHNGKILVNNNFLNSIPNSLVKQKIEFKGSSSQGIFKEGIDSTSNVTHTKIELFKINEIGFKNQITTFTKGDSKIGNSFFSNYNYIVDWNQKLLFLEEFEERKNQDYVSYGFGKILRDKTVSITEIMRGSNAYKLLKIGDQIIEYNGKDWSSINQSEWCEYVKDKEWPEILNMKVLRDEKIIDIQIKKETFIE